MNFCAALSHLIAIGYCCRGRRLREGIRGFYAALTRVQARNRGKSGGVRNCQSETRVDAVPACVK